MKVKHSAVLLLMPLLFACSKPLPPDRLDYAGEWRSKEMRLLILEDGTVAYKRLKNGGSTSVNGPLKEFQGDDFVVGVGPFATTFEVSKPPYQVNGSWRMDVDGVTLIRIPPLAE